MTGEDSIVIEAMIRYGGSFVNALGRAALCADNLNLALIKTTWPEYWEKYREMAERKA